MIKKIGALLEEHIEKIILIVVGLLCSWVLVTRVLLSPNVVEYDRKTYTAGKVDEQILDDAMGIRDKKVAPDITPIVMKPGEQNYATLFDDPLKDIKVNFPPLAPGSISTNNRNVVYGTPVIPRPTNLDVEYIRAVAYEPKIPVTRDKPYTNSDCEPNDLDLVTVQAKFDMAKLINEFKKCYIDSVSQEYADPCMAQPIFASVNLQRQQMNPDGTWSNEWENVPRTKIDFNGDLFKVVESYSDLPIGGLALYKLQLKNKLNQLDLLQPEGYQIASAKDEWFPPKLHREYLDAQKKDEKQAKENATAQNNNNVTSTPDTGRRRDNRSSLLGGGIGQTGGVNTTTGSGLRSRRGRASRSGGTTTDNTTVNNNPRRRGSRGTNTNTTTATVQQEYGTLGPNGEPITEVTKVFDDFYNIVLKPDTDLSRMSESIIIWAHDDTVQPENTYKYRIRIGVLNPAAEEEGDTIVFWSEPSEVTKPISIEGKMYFFAREVQQAAKTVTVAIYKLDLGYWFKNEFKVGQGEVIGHEAEVTFNEEDSSVNINTKITSPIEQTRMINYATGDVMIDVTPVNEWSQGVHSLSFKPYYDMMYSSDGIGIEHTPVTTNYRPWPEIYKKWLYVESRIKEKPEPLKPWGSNEMQLFLIQSGQYTGMLYR